MEERDVVLPERLTDQCADAGPSPRSPDLLAALAAAKRYPLIRKVTTSAVCPGSEMPTVGWWPRAPYSDWQAANDLGGPWPVETIARLCQLGLLTVQYDDPGKARATKTGLALIRPPRRKPRDGGEAVHTGQIRDEK